MPAPARPCLGVCRGQGGHRRAERSGLERSCRSAPWPGLELRRTGARSSHEVDATIRQVQERASKQGSACACEARVVHEDVERPRRGQLHVQARGPTVARDGRGPDTRHRVIEDVDAPGPSCGPHPTVRLPVWAQASPRASRNFRSRSLHFHPARWADASKGGDETAAGGRFSRSARFTRRAARVTVSRIRHPSSKRPTAACVC